MQQPLTAQEMQDRLTLIEKMIAEGRRSTECWGWAFVLWGIAYYVALGWSAWRPTAWAWPVTVSIAVIVTILVAYSMIGKRPSTTLGRGVGSIWIAAGISMFLLFFSLGLSGRLNDQHIFMAAISAVLGIANGASALFVRWRVQLACAVVWWITAVATCFGTGAESTIIFVVAIFLCQILFGIYAMIVKGHERTERAAFHA